MKYDHYKAIFSFTQKKRKNWPLPTQSVYRNDNTPFIICG